MMEYLRMQTSGGDGLELVRYEGHILPKLDSVDIVQGLKYAKEFEYRPDDIILCTYPKCGTHWMGNMIWRLKNLDISNRPNDAFLELGPPEVFENMDSPRIIFTHLKPSCLPKEHIKNRGKIVLMLRNPKDVLVSYYHILKDAALFKSKQTWEEFFQSHMSGVVPVGTFFDHVQQWEDFLKENPDQNVGIFYYEDFKANLNDNLARLNKFLGFNRDQEYIEEVKKATTFSALKEQDASGKRETLNMVRDEKGDSVIYRKGEVGDWKNYFTMAQSDQVDERLSATLKHGIITINHGI